MTQRKLLIGFVLCLVALSEVSAQDNAAAQEHRWTLNAGIGPNYYLNNLVVAKGKVTEVNYSFVARVMWEPEYFLSLGFETGYNRLYSLSGNASQTGNISIVNVAIPLQVVISMKFLKHYYCNFNLGQAILLNNVSTAKQGNNDASVVSLGDFGACIGYRKDISERFTLGGELKGYYSTKLNDRNISLVFMAGYRLW